MKIKIVSDGSPGGTKIVNAETGEKVEMIHKIEWSLVAGRTAEAKLHFLKVQVDIEVDAEVVEADPEISRLGINEGEQN